ncbi:hypothetical protein [Spirochaeta lutea]|uniref:Uncharacterized protein n=1 Tax=Spirochaeta lutea TaxID=1480694 RepID=A0A098R1A2_9SPIO|nr:hypothetical protein [Spirochaeta lutea]KGE73556.1 hypothetical protein DC28_02520 [Spirochaeta lutea]
MKDNTNHPGDHRPRITVQKNAQIYDQDPSLGHGFHYSREERLGMMARNRGEEQKQSWFKRNRVLIITLLDIVFLVIIAVLFNTVLAPKPWKTSTPGYTLSLETHEFGPELLNQLILTPVDENLTSLSIRGGFLLLSLPSLQPGYIRRIRETVAAGLTTPDLDLAQWQTGIQRALPIPGLSVVSALEVRDVLGFAGQREGSLRGRLPWTGDNPEEDGVFVVVGYVQPIVSDSQAENYPSSVVLRQVTP